MHNQGNINIERQDELLGMGAFTDDWTAADEQSYRRWLSELEADREYWRREHDKIMREIENGNDF